MSSYWRNFWSPDAPKVIKITTCCTVGVGNRWKKIFRCSAIVLGWRSDSNKESIYQTRTSDFYHRQGKLFLTNILAFVRNEYIFDNDLHMSWNLMFSFQFPILMCPATPRHATYEPRNYWYVARFRGPFWTSSHQNILEIMSNLIASIVPVDGTSAAKMLKKFRYLNSSHANMRQ